MNLEHVCLFVCPLIVFCCLFVSEIYVSVCADAREHPANLAVCLLLKFSPTVPDDESPGVSVGSHQHPNANKQRDWLLRFNCKT